MYTFVWCEVEAKAKVECEVEACVWLKAEACVWCKVWLVSSVKLRFVSMANWC